MYMIDRTTAFVWQVASGGSAFVAPLAALTKTAASATTAPAKRITRVPTAYPRSKCREGTALHRNGSNGPGRRPQSGANLGQAVRRDRIPPTAITSSAAMITAV